MAKLLQILSSVALLLAAAHTARSQTTSFYLDFNGTPPPELILEGDAHFPAYSPNLRLTKTDDSGNALPWSGGRAVYSKSFKFWEAGARADMETTIKFIIKPNSGDSNPADGLTFFIQPTLTPMGADGGSLALFDSAGQKAATFAVEFDTYINSGVDPSYRHVGIDIESNVSKDTINIGEALLGQVVTARINYEEATKAISVHVDVGSEHYEMSYVYDLTTILPQDVQVGISGATGGSVTIHDVISWYFTSALVHSNEGGNIRQVV